MQKLKGLIAEKNLSQRKVAAMLGISERTFYSKMKSGNFTLTEAKTLVSLLDIKDPNEVFFAQ